ncbi:MAG TPA: alpha/beta fold hydrolase, partial [Burkholderiales bacterium]|nr:alpha/beta fold hydrolase [Burkholderiales bacterium]
MLLLHGFPELSYSWRKVIPRLTDAGYHVLAPDLRGYGKTTGWDGSYDGDVASFAMLNLVWDCVALLSHLRIRQCHVVGHDFGAPLAAYCALTRPEVFRSVVLMSAPFGGMPVGGRAGNIHEDLAKLGRKHYQWYFSTREADDDMRRCPQGVHAFLRAYYHHKSADWKGNKPHRLAGWTAEELAKMPTYYIMDLYDDMPAAVGKEMPSAAEIAANPWLTEA